MRFSGILGCAALALAGEVRADAALLPSRTDVERFAAAVRWVAAGPARAVRDAVAPAPPLAAGPAALAGKVARTPGGRRYHRVGCRSALGQVRLLSREEAEAAGLAACRRCLVPRAARRRAADPHGPPPAAPARDRPWDHPRGAAP